MNESLLFVDLEQLSKSIGPKRAKKTHSVARKLMKSIARRLRLKHGEVLTGRIADWKINSLWVLYVRLGVVVPKESCDRSCELKHQYSFAAIFISVSDLNSNRWGLSVGECDTTIERMTRDIHRAFRVDKRSVQDNEYM